MRMKTDYKDKSIKSSSTKSVKKDDTMVWNFPPTATSPAMSIEAKSAGEAEAIYQKKVAALSNKTNQS